MDIHIVIAVMVMVITVKQIPYNTTQAKQNAIKILVMSSMEAKLLWTFTLSLLLWSWLLL